MTPLENLVFYIFLKAERGFSAIAFYRMIFALSCEYCRYFEFCFPSVDFIKKKTYPYSPDVKMLLDRMEEKEKTIQLKGHVYSCKKNKYNPLLFTSEERKLINRVFFSYCYRRGVVPYNFENNPVWKRTSCGKKLYITKDNLRSVDELFKRGVSKPAGTAVAGTGST